MAGAGYCRLMRVQVVLAGLLFLGAIGAAGCATTGSTAVAGRADQGYPACEAGVGASPDAPVSRKTLSALLTRERLVCPGGAIGRTGAPDTSPAFPDTAVTDHTSMAIACPDTEYRVYVSPAGSTTDAPSCVPAPLSMISPGVSMLIDDSTRELSTGDFRNALRLAARAKTMQPDSEAVQIALGTAQMANRQFKEAEATLARALEINDGSPAVRLAHAVCLSEIGEKAMYAAEVFRLYDDVPVSDPLHWDLTCRVADNFNRIGNRQEAIRLARVACEHGVAMCCDLAHSDIEAREVE